MIDGIDNGIQTAVLFLCTFLAARKAFELDSRVWTLLAFFFGNFALDDLYLLICLLTVGWTSTLSVVSELSWYASFIFLYLLIRQVAPPESLREKRLLPWLCPVFTFGMAAFFIRWGEIASNLIYAALLGLVLFSAVRRLMSREKYQKQRFLCASAVLLCLLEYGLWTISCFFKSDDLSNPYYFVDLLITLSFPLFIVGTRKAMRE